MVEQMPKASEQHSTTDKPIVGRMQREIAHRTQVKEFQQTIYEQTQRKKLLSRQMAAFQASRSKVERFITDALNDVEVDIRS